MIPKVKPAPLLRMVRPSGETKNELGGQSGNAYSKEEPPSEPSQPTEPTQETPSSSPPPERSEAELEGQVGLSVVLREWHESPHPSPHLSAAKLSQKYQGEAMPAKGVLLNKKMS